MKTISERQWNCLKNWATACHQNFHRSGHMLPLIKIPADNGGFTLSGTPASDVSKDEVDEWNNFLNHLIRDDIVQIARYRGNLTEYRFTSIEVVERIRTL